MRNKIYFTKKLPPVDSFQEYNIINIGKVLSNAFCIDAYSFIKQSKLDAFEYFKKLIDSVMTMAIPVFTNFGILQEKEFELNIQKLFLDYAKDYQLIIYWPHIVRDNVLVWSENTSENKNIYFSYNILERIEI